MGTNSIGMGTLGLETLDTRTLGNRLGRMSAAVVMTLSLLCVAGCQPAGTTVEHSRLTTNQRAPGSTSKQWNQLRGPTGQGIAEGKLPRQWSDKQNILWQTKLPGAGSATPLVHNGRIYLTCYSGYAVPGDQGKLENLSRHMLCIDSKTGQVLWDEKVETKLPEPASIRDHGYAANTGVVDDDRVYGFFGKSGVVAFDHDGKQLWQRSVGDKTSDWGSGSSLVLHDDLVIVNASVESESVIALEAATGDVRWKVGNIKESWSTPVVATARSGRTELVVGMFGKVIGLDPESGKQLWQCESDISWYMVPTPVVADGVVYCFGGRSGTSALAIELGGSGDVTNSHRKWTSVKGTNVCSPLIIDGRLYWTSDQQGIAYCADAETGKLIYEERLPRCDQVYASAYADDEAIYYTDRSGKTFVVRIGPDFRLLEENKLSDGTQFNASPACVDGQVFLRSQSTLYCIGK